ncbi:FAD/NAD(P)-binding protein [Flavobacterium sp. XGLA_31]|uniref:FAD/NAD(P)-binding protein n=1 Tax=Flavobacterium sp. XGLA_31 TaxID=3447666 RepID=UPI003F3A612F
MKTIGIIGAGFSGTMTAVQLIEKSTTPCEIIVINERETLNKGFAYNPYSDKHLLNVIAGKMSAFPDNQDHFLDWVMERESFSDKDRTLIANSFLPRKLYGEYLVSVWNTYLKIAQTKNITVTVIDSFVVDLDPREESVQLWLDNNQMLTVDECVIASGNLVPRNPRIKNPDFYQSPNYFQNPWKADSVQNTNPDLPVLIVGNGLTMVDTVVGLMEQGFKNDIYSISPNGFNILPHRHNGLKYTKLIEELREDMSLFDLVKLVHKHIKAVREYGATAEPVIDSLRPFTQNLWKRFSTEEKSIFMSRLRHLWGVARHRIPIHTHDKLQQLRIDGKLKISSGRLLNFTEDQNVITVEYFDKKEHVVKTLKVSRIINCTGPETDLMNVEKSFLKNCLLKGILTQDSLKLGIVTNTDTFQIINAEGKTHSHLFTIGGNLKGELWESTAVNELRRQAENLVGQLCIKAQPETAKQETGTT